jgi:K+-transporting ATPase KdpF subunit
MSSWWPSGLVSFWWRWVPANTSEENEMLFDYTLAGLVAAGLLCYLLYALLRPERF